MIGWLVSLGFWNWFILGALLLIAELLAPGVFMVWLAIAALAVGLLSFVVVWSWQAQVIAFALFSVVAIVVGRKLSRPAGDVSEDHVFLNRRTAGYVGRVFALETAIVHGAGTVRIDDTVWRVSGPDLPAGTSVRVIAADGVNLTVEPA
ncbi:MAG TPA: NfeD family protein [Xanthobacteraceae bacterium]|nr:NfeD family protein [Xanthobacteraceae bacterium]